MIANKVFVTDGFSVADAFREEIAKYYTSEVESVNFLEKEETATVLIYFRFKKTIILVDFPENE
jgi:serine protease inhibitor